jgi:serine/threonine protein kinase
MQSELKNERAMNKEVVIEADRANYEALAPGSKLLSGQYEILRYLSSGGFGITYLARDSLNRTVVIKECFPEAFCNRVNRSVRARTQNYLDDFKSIVRLFIREAHALSRLSHSSVVGVHQVFEDNETAYMALDLVDGRDLLDIIESPDRVMRPEQVRDLTLRLLDAIGHVHSQDMLHRDISPDNILLDKSGRPVLIDFGAAREEASRKSRVLSAVLVVKDGYSPQEFYVAGSQQLPCSDLYALAATLSHLISGEAPPHSQARLAALASNQPDLYRPLLGRFPEYDDAFLQAIDKAMNIVPSERLQSAEEWALMIDHSKRLEMARERARQDKSIDVTIMNLVKSANSQPILTRQNDDPQVPAERVPDPSAREEDWAPAALLNAPDPVSSTDADEVLIEDLSSPETVEEDNWFALSDANAEPEDDKTAQTPYLRIQSKAQAAAMAVERTPRRISRLATVPVIFCAYFFYAHAALQVAEINAATLQPLLALSEEFTDWGHTKSSNDNSHALLE